MKNRDFIKRELSRGKKSVLELAEKAVAEGVCRVEDVKLAKRSLAVTVCHLLSEGQIEKAKRGVYRLPTPKRDAKGHFLPREA